MNALLRDYLTAVADHPARAISDLHAELTAIDAFVARWWATAEAEPPADRPYSIAIGLLLLRAERLRRAIGKN